MEAQYRAANGRLILKVQGEKQKDLFRQLAVAQEVFDAENSCGLCQSARIHFRVRTVESMDFYELVCLDCYARFEYGQHKNGSSLFPKRRGDDGPLPHRGWSKWERKENPDAE